MNVFTKKEWVISHLFIISGLIFLSLGIYRNFEEPEPLIGGLWALMGGFCFVVAFALRHLKQK